jgi:hypothetical protein
MFRSLTLAIFRGIVPVAMLLSALLSSSQLYLGMWLYFVLLSCAPSRCGSFGHHTTTVNLTNIRFSQEELALLNNGLQHCIEKPLKKYWTNLIMETEQAIRMLDSKMQAPFRILATKKLRQISTSDNHNNVMAKRQTCILKNINNKLEKENAMIVKADKGETCVVIYTDEYSKKSLQLP